jgi:hypothetical protein
VPSQGVVENDTVRRGVGGVKITSLFFGLVTVLGLTVTLGSSYLIVRGPFLGGASLDPVPLLGTLGVFVVGIIVLTWGLTKFAGVGARV